MKNKINENEQKSYNNKTWVETANIFRDYFELHIQKIFLEKLMRMDLKFNH